MKFAKHLKLKRQQGVALFLMVVAIMVVITSVLIGQVSIRQLKLDRQKGSVAILNEAERLLFGYALRQAALGTLPCPAQAPDGEASVDASGCVSNVGFLPYKTLESDALTDASDTLLWYAVDERLTMNNSTRKNSSLDPTLLVDGQDAVFLVIAPGANLSSRARSSADVDAFLEGVNADGNADDFAQGVGEAQNDIVKGMSPLHFWPAVETRVLSAFSAPLIQYKNACGEFPWAANFGSTMSSSVQLQQFGGIPMDSALPFDWNTLGECSQGISLPATLSAHWEAQLYFRFCLDGEADCLAVDGPVASNAQAILLAPGVEIGGQNRSGSDVTDFFESDNAIENTQFVKRNASDIDGSFNDVLYEISP